MKKMLSLVLAVLMLFSLLPVMNVAAAETETRIIEGESMTKVSGPAGSGVQSMASFGNAGFSNGQQYWSGWDLTPNYTMELSFNLKDDFKGSVDIAYCTAADFGIFDIYLDDQLLLEDLDMYFNAGEVGEGVKRQVSDFTNEIELAAGTHTLKLENVGQNPASSGYIGSVDCLILDGEFTKTIDWSRVTDVIEAEDMTVVQGQRMVQPMHALFPTIIPLGVYSADKGIWFHNDNEGGPIAEGTALALSFETDYAYTGAMTIAATVAGDFGIFDIYLDDVQVYDNLDMYNAGLAHKEFKVEEVTLNPGTHTLKLVNAGKNEKATNFFAGLDCLKFDTYVADRNKNIVIEGELMNIETGEMVIQARPEAGFSLGYQMWSGAVVDGDVAELSFNLEYPYQGMASIAYCMAADFGIYDIYLDDELMLDDQDMYSPELKHSGLIEMGKVDLAAGNHVLKLVADGKNDNAVGYMFAVDCLALNQIEYTYSYVDAVNMIDDLEAIALLPNEGEAGGANTSYHRVSRYDEATDTYIEWGDKEPGATQGVGWTNNADNNGNFGPADDGKGGIIAVDIKGAGMIVRSWFATLGDGNIDVYIDGNTEPAISMSTKDFVSSTADNRYNGLNNLVYTTAAAGNDNYVPITFNESCKVILREGWGNYYHFSYRLFAEGETVEPIEKTFTKEQQDALEALNERLGDCSAAPEYEGEEVAASEASIALPAGETTTIFATEGEAAITQFKVNFNDELDKNEKIIAMQMLEISMFWDGNEDPAVWAPFGDFFANSGGQAYQSVPSGITEDGTFYSYWYMPYADGAKIVIENLDDVDYDISVEVVTAPLAGNIADYGRFHAKWSLNNEAGRGSDYTILKTEGRGRFVGTNLHVLNITPTYWWGEGDEKFFVDGEKFPSTYGTGSEDYFGYAWCSAGYFNQALHAQNWTPGTIGAKGDYNNVRFHIADNIPFQTSFEGALEKFHTDDITQYGFTAFWYLDANGVDPYEPVKYEGEEAEYRYMSLDIIRDEMQRPLNTNVIEGEDMEIVDYKHMGNSFGVQNMDVEWPSAGSFSNGKQVYSGFGNGVTSESEMTLEFVVQEDFEGVLQAALCGAGDYGIVQLYIDDVAIGDPIDCYATEVLHLGLKKIAENVTLTAGTHELRMAIVGKSNSSRGYLFGLDCLVLGEHVLNHSAATEANCTTPGYPDHWACADCDKVFEDRYGTVEIAGELMIPVDPENHPGETEVVNAKEMSHYYDGYTGDTICVSCEKTLIEGEVITAEHVANATATVVEPTCIAEGYTLYECPDCDLNYVDNFVDALEHDYTSEVTKPTHDAMGYTTYTCENCGDSYIDDFTDALEHEYKQEVTTKATCVAEGVMTFTCECGESYTMALPKGEHECTATVIKATDVSYGYTQNDCVNCDYSYISDFVQPTGSGVVEPECPAKDFTDVDTEAWYHDAVDYALTNELMNGVGDGKFAPDGTVTRGQIVTILYRAAGSPSVAGLDNPFTDVGDTWYTDAVIWAAEEGVVNGVSATAFAPDQAVTREQLVTILYRYDGETEADSKVLADYTDAASISSYAEDAFAWAIENGIVNGVTETTLAPAATATRAQIAAIFMRYLEKA